MEGKIHLSIIIPAYNEEKRLSNTLIEVDEYLSKQSYTYEILVIDDGSKDKTFQIAKSLVSQVKNLKPLRYEINRGKGYAVKYGMLKAEGDYRLFTDADNSTSIDQVEKMWPFFEQGYDVVVGSRDTKGAVLDPPQPIHRRILGEAFGLLTKILSGTWGIQDTQCGFKGLTKKAAENIFPKCRIDRFAFDPEILIIAKKLKYKIKEIPVYWKNDLESKVKISSMIKMGIDLLKISRNIITGKYK